eukprot:COSAG03_NODE_11074_length_612_cov_1.974659_1_plen_29_part_10
MELSMNSGVWIVSTMCGDMKHRCGYTQTH